MISIVEQNVDMELETFLAFDGPKLSGGNGIDREVHLHLDQQCPRYIKAVLNKVSMTVEVLGQGIIGHTETFDLFFITMNDE